MNFWLHVRENWHEGVIVACSHVIVAAWKAVGLPIATQCAVGLCRLAYETGRFWIAAMLA